jgi:hypothetical protein
VLRFLKVVVGQDTVGGVVVIFIHRRDLNGLSGFNEFFSLGLGQYGHFLSPFEDNTVLSMSCIVVQKLHYFLGVYPYFLLNWPFLLRATLPTVRVGIVKPAHFEHGAMRFFFGFVAAFDFAVFLDDAFFNM